MQKESSLSARSNRDAPSPPPQKEILRKTSHYHEYTLRNVSMPVSNPEAEAGDKTYGIIGYKKLRVSLKQGLAGVFQWIQSSRSNFDCNRPHCSVPLKYLSLFTTSLSVK